MTPEKICKLWRQLDDDRSSLKRVWELIGQYIMPFRSEFYTHLASENSKDWRENREIYDSTAIHAANTLSAAIHGSLTSPVTQWFNIVFRNKNVQDNPTARKWIEHASHVTYTAYQDSNFNLEANEGYLDFVGYGNAFISEEAEVRNGNFQELRFESNSLDSSVYIPDHRGRVKCFIKQLMWLPDQIISKFGKDEVPQIVLDRANSAPTDKMCVYFCIYPREGVEKSEYQLKQLAPKQRPYAYKYVLETEKVQLGEEGGYHEMPVFHLKWRKAASSIWAFGPGLIAIWDVLTLQQVEEMILEALGKAIDPASITTERGLLSDLDLGKGGLTVVRKIEELIPYESRANFDAGYIEKAALQRDIRSIFFVDQLELKDSPAMTATETQVRYELMQRLLGPTLGRLESDWLDPCVKRTFSMLYRHGQFDPLPEELMDSNSRLDINYVGPLVRAQQSDIAQGVMRWIATLSELSQVKEEVLDVPDWDALAIGLSQLEGVPARFISDLKTIKRSREERKQKQERMEEAMIAEQEGKAKELEANAVEGGKPR